MPCSKAVKLTPGPDSSLAIHKWGRKRLTAERKLEVYRLTRDPNAPVGEILRKAGITLEQLREIEETIESGALAALKVHARNGTGTGPVSREEYNRLAVELREKEKALAKMGVEYTLFKKVHRYFSEKEQGDWNEASKSTLRNRSKRQRRKA